MAKHIKQECRKDFSTAVKDNLKHTLPEGFYAGVAVASAHGSTFLNSVEGAKPIAKYIPYVGPVVLAANTFARISEINEHEKDTNVRIESFEGALAQTILNIGVYTSASMLLAAAPAAALPVLGTFIGCEFLLSGDNAPVDYLRDTVADSLHMLHVGELVDYIF
ncbi:MAG: hypothetical protein ACHP6I_00365 [Rickettsiales bacterium]